MKHPDQRIEPAVIFLCKEYIFYVQYINIKGFISMDRKFEYLEHTADAKFRAYGNTLEEAFESAAFAMFNVMIDTSTVDEDIFYEMRLSADDLEGLLFNWLSEILFVFEVEDLVFADFTVEQLEEKDGLWNLVARVAGEEVDLPRHKFGTEVKAATYNEMLIEKVPDGWMVQATVDT